eukprot:3859739-Rhodomonas_salina.1
MPSPSPTWLLLSESGFAHALHPPLSVRAWRVFCRSGTRPVLPSANPRTLLLHTNTLCPRQRPPPVSRTGW